MDLVTGYAGVGLVMRGQVDGFLVDWRGFRIWTRIFLDFMVGYGLGLNGLFGYGLIIMIL